MRLMIWLALAASPAFGLSTAYVNFEHPDGWRCELSQGVWICQSTVEPDRKESVVFSIATMATEWDTLDNYENYLKQARPIQDEDGNTLTSKVTYTRRRNINGTVWVDSLQFNSELPGFWARYCATVTNKLAILITYIVSNEQYQKLAPQFERMVSSLKPNSEFDLNVPSKQTDGPMPGSQKFGGGLPKDLLIGRLNVGKKKPEKPVAPTVDATPAQGNNNLLYMVGGGAVIALLLLRMRRPKKKPVAQAPRGPQQPQRREPPPPSPGRRTG